MSEEKKDFVVKDKRIFSEENQEKTENGGKGVEPGETVESDETDKKPEKSEADEKPEKSEADEKPEKSKPDQKPETEARLPQINFITFIMSLNSSILVQLGIIEDPVTGKKEKNLPVAKQTIDILGMLEEKTKGNLTHEEEQIMKNFLYELRMIYVKEMQ